MIKDSFGNYLTYFGQGADPGVDFVNQLVAIQIPFTYGQPQYIKAEAQAYLYGEGDIDFANTVTIVSVEVPEDTAVYSYSSYLFGTPTGYQVVGGIDGNLAEGGYGGFFGGGGGGGGGGGEIPLPAPLLLFGLALLALGGALRRR